MDTLNNQFLEYVEDSGWWFWDETGANCFGPFPSDMIANGFLNRYAYEVETDDNSGPNSFKKLIEKFEKKYQTKLQWKTAEEIDDNADS